MLQGAIIGAIVGGIIGVVMLFLQKKTECPACRKRVDHVGAPPKTCPHCKADLTETRA